MYAAVFPEPVLDRAVFVRNRRRSQGKSVILPRISLPSNANGIVCACTGVGFEKFSAETACSSRGSRLSSSNLKV